MRPSLLARCISCVLSALLVPCLSAAAASPPPGRVLYAFSDCGDSIASLIGDAAGNLYGSTALGGTNNHGCIFELSPVKNGWLETTLYIFAGSDGSGPDGALVFDKLGNLYGTTATGGVYGGGTVFALSPSGDGAWSEIVLHSFGAEGDGAAPECNLVFDSQGNLYGTTLIGFGTRTGGTVFRLSPGQSGWTETVLYTFPGSINGPDGDAPKGGVVMDREGRLYGATESGGAHGAGAVYELIPYQSGYREKIIYSFDVADGYQPMSGLTIGPEGDLYGTTTSGGTASACPFVGCGIVFALKKASDGSWSEEILLQMSGSDGSSSIGPVVFDSKGNLYAAAQFGGIRNGGSVFMLTPTQTGPWTETVLHLFDFIPFSGKDGQQPYAGVIYGAGRVFGTTSSGGVNDSGIVFEITPPRPDFASANPATPQEF